MQTVKPEVLRALANVYAALDSWETVSHAPQGITAPTQGATAAQILSALTSLVEATHAAANPRATKSYIPVTTTA
jgi:hypothetical protein